MRHQPALQALFLATSLAALIAANALAEDPVLEPEFQNRLNQLETIQASHKTLTKIEATELKALQSILPVLKTLARVKEVHQQSTSNSAGNLPPHLLKEILGYKTNVLAALQENAGLLNPDIRNKTYSTLFFISNLIDEITVRQRDRELSDKDKDQLRAADTRAYSDIKTLSQRWLSMRETLTPLAPSEKADWMSRTAEVESEYDRLTSLPYHSLGELLYRKTLQRLLSALKTTLSVNNWLSTGSDKKLAGIRSERNSIRDLSELRSQFTEKGVPLPEETQKLVLDKIKRSHEKILEFHDRAPGKLDPEAFLRHMELLRLHKNGVSLLMENETLLKYRSKSLSLLDPVAIEGPDCLNALTSDEKSRIQALVAMLSEINSADPSADRSKAPCCIYGRNELDERLKTFSPQAMSGFLAFHQLKRYFDSMTELKEAEKLTSVPQAVPAVPESQQTFPDLDESLRRFAAKDPIDLSPLKIWTPPDAETRMPSIAQVLNQLMQGPKKEDVIAFCKEALTIADRGPEAVRAALLETMNPSQLGCLRGSSPASMKSKEQLAMEIEKMQPLQAKGGLSEEEIQAIGRYTSGGFNIINAALRKGGELQKRNQRNIDTLKGALAKLPDFRGLVRRGDNLPPEVLMLHQVGQIVEYPSFVSTSYNYGFRSNMRILMYVQSCKKIDELSAFKYEKEVLCPPGTRFKVLERKTDPKGKTYIIMKEVSPDT